MNGLVVNGFQYPAILNGSMPWDDVVLTTRGVLMLLALDDWFM